MPRNPTSAYTVSRTISDKTLNRIMAIESAGNPRAKAKTSSASGLFQFINATWDATVAKHRPDLKAGLTRDQVRALRFNPSIAIELGARFTEDNAKGLGRAYTDGDLYLAHFLGLGMARKFLRADPEASAAQLAGPAAVKANPSILGGKKTVRDVRAWAEKKMEKTHAALKNVDWVTKYYTAEPVKDDTPVKVEEPEEPEAAPDNAILDGKPDVPDEVDDVKEVVQEGIVARIKSVLRSKIAWLAGILGSTGAGTTVSTDPEVQGLLMRLVSKPAFWVVVVCLVAAGAIIYYRWRDHGKGAK